MVALVTTDLLARNAAFSLTCANQEHVPVVKGQATPLMSAYHGQSGIEIHGSDGLGNTERPFAASTTPLRHSHTSAARYLVDICAASPGEITLVTLGPLTNIAVRVDEGHMEGHVVGARWHVVAWKTEAVGSCFRCTRRLPAFWTRGFHPR